MKKLISLVGATCLAFGAAAAESHPTGLRPHPHPIHRVTSAATAPAAGVRRAAMSAAEEPLPDRYDLRDTGHLSPVRDQGSYNTCWTFATMSCLEYQVRDKEGIDVDFSENNLISMHGFATGYEGGGDYEKSTAVILREECPVSEMLDYYTEGDNTEGKNPPRFGQSVREHAVRVPRKMVHVAARTTAEPNATFTNEINVIKRAIKAYGALMVGYESESGKGYEAENVKSYYYDGAWGASDHAVALVGWDDTYSKTHFAHTPPGDGAFIIRNSWGPDLGDHGYMYISYYDHSLCTSDSCVWLKLTDGTDYGHLYQYDTFGRVDQKGNGPGQAMTAANVFTACADEDIAAFGTYANDAGAEYKAQIIANPVFNGKTVFGETLATKSGTYADSGYEVVDFEEPASIGAGTNFAIVITLTSPTDESPIDFTCNMNYPADMGGGAFTTGVVARAGLSWMKKGACDSDYAWEDMSIQTNYFCAKVYAAAKDPTAATTSTESPVSLSWLDAYSDSTTNGTVAAGSTYLATYFYGSYNALAEHRGANGFQIADSYARGLDPDRVGETNLVATITMEDGKPVIGVTPCNSNLWSYATEGSTDLEDWHPQGEGDTFFKVRVSEKQ